MVIKVILKIMVKIGNKITGYKNQKTPAYTGILPAV